MNSANPYRTLPKSHFEKDLEEEEKDSSYDIRPSSKEIKYHGRSESMRAKFRSDIDNQNDKITGSVLSKMSIPETGPSLSQSKFYCLILMLAIINLLKTEMEKLNP